MARNIGADLSCMREEDKPYVFVESLRELQHACGVDNLKMSDYGIRREDFPRLVQLARNAMGGLVRARSRTAHRCRYYPDFRGVL